MKNPSGAPNMVWGMYILISLNRIYGIKLSPLKISALPGWISVQTGTRLVIDALEKKFGALGYHDPRVQTVIDMAKSMELEKSNPGKVRKNIFLFNNPPSGPADEDSARELEIYIENDGDLHRQQFIPIVKNLMLKRRKGIYDREKAVTLFMYLMESGAKKYVREFVQSSERGSIPPKIDTVFNKNTRLLAARRFRDSFETEAELGNYDRLIGPVSNPHNVRKNIFLFNNPKRKGAHEAFDVYLDGKEIDTVFWVPGTSADEVRRSLVNHDGYDSQIVVMKRGASGRHIETSPEDNPRGRGDDVSKAATSIGLHVATWSSGDGVTRYRFFKKSGNTYFGPDNGIFTALGRKEAMSFIQAFGAGGGAQSNPPSKSVRTFSVPRGYEEKVARMLRDAFIWAQARSGEVLTLAKPAIVKRAIEYVRKHGYPVTEKNPLTRSETASALRKARMDLAGGRSYPKGSPRGSFFIGRAAGRAETIHDTASSQRSRYLAGNLDTKAYAALRNPCSNPVCKNPKHGHVRCNPLLQTVMLANPGLVKTFNEMQNVGKAKYVVNYHDGVKVHRDGSPFFDIAIFSSRAKKDRFVRELESLGFTRGALRNPPLSSVWNRLTHAQRQELLEISGVDQDAASVMSMSAWTGLRPSTKSLLEMGWHDPSRRTSGDTTRRIPMTVGARNPLTDEEAKRSLSYAHGSLRMAKKFPKGNKWRSHHAGRAEGQAIVVHDRASSRHYPEARRIMNKSLALEGVKMNPGTLRLPKPGTKMTVAQALDLARRIGNKDLIKQCQEAIKLQGKANAGAKTVTWKHLPMGSKTSVEAVVALVHYGDSPETMYKPPKGSKKGNHMYRHSWGETGGKRSVPLLVAPGGKTLIMPLEGKKVAGDWLRH